MSRGNVATWTVADYEQAAQEYLERLPPEHFMEATPHSTQREITLESLAVLRARRPDVQVCNELLVQYPMNGDLGQVCPDNMVVLSDQPLQAMGSFNTPFEQGTILWVLEYVSPSNKRKDYVDNLRRYGEEMKVPYYLIFDPESKDLRLYHHNGVGYDRVAINDAGRLAIRELEVEVAVTNGWVRFWHRGELLPLPAELLSQMERLQARLDEAEERAYEERRRANREQQRADEEHRRADEAHRRAEEERLKAEEQRRNADGQKRLADEQKRQADEERRRAEEADRRADEERRSKVQAEAEVERLRALLAQLQGGANP